MGEDRHARLALHALDQALAAARHDHVDRAIEPREHHADGGALPCRHQRDGGSRQFGFGEAFDQSGMNGAGGAEAFRAAAQDHGIAGLQAERARIGGDVRAALVDHADNAERHPHPLDPHAVRTPPRCHHRADRILELADDIDAGGHGLDALGVERQAVEEGRSGTRGLRLGDVLGVGGKNSRARAADSLGHGGQRAVLA